MSRPSMQVSAVALIDALGFREIWRRWDPHSVAQTLGSVRAVISGMKRWIESPSRDVASLGGLPDTHVGWFSDTIYVIAQPPLEPYGTPVDPNEKMFQAHLLHAVAMCVGYGIREAATLRPPLVFRGVITIGDAYVGDGNIYLGSAINEAAKHCERADGAFIWLSPAASALPEVADARGVYVDYQVPLKGGQSIKTRAINPFVDASRDPGVLVREGFEQAMKSTGIDVTVKRQNTLQFLDYAAPSR